MERTDAEIIQALRDELRATKHERDELAIALRDEGKMAGAQALLMRMVESILDVVRHLSMRAHAGDVLRGVLEHGFGCAGAELDELIHEEHVRRKAARVSVGDEVRVCPSPTLGQGGDDTAD